MLKRLAMGVGVNIFDKLVIAVTQLVTVPLLAHAWGLQLYGLWVMLSTVPTFLAMGDLGFATAAGTRMTIAEARGNRDEVIGIFQSAWAAILISSAVFTLVAVVAVLLAPAAWLGDKALRMTLLVLLLYGILAVQGSIFFAGFRAAGQFALGAFWNAIIIVIESVALFATVLLGGSPLAAALALMLGRLAGLAGQNLLLRRAVPWLPIGLRHATRTTQRELLAPAGAVMLVPMAQACMLQGTALALGAAAGQAAVPAFTAARTLSRVGQQMCWTVNAALMPELSSAIGRRDRGAIAMMVLGTLAVSMVLIAPFALLFGVFGQQIILLWSRGIIHAPLPMVWMMGVSILAGGFWVPLSNLILAADRQSSFSAPYTVLAALAVPVTWVLARSMGATAPALAMAGGDAIMLVLVLVLVERHLIPLAMVWQAGPRARARAVELIERVRKRAA